MNTRFHVRTKVFGGRRPRNGADGASGGSNAPVIPASLTGTDPILIDPMPDGNPGMAASYLIPGTRTALVDPGPANSAPRVLDALAFRGIEVDVILLTHIHPDAAAGTGMIARRFPGAEIAAPAETTTRLTDPAALVSDMKRVYGDKAEKLYGVPDPIDRGRITPLGDSDRIDLGDRSIEVISTPGHTAAHVAFLDHSNGSLFCGDALGVQLPGSRVVRPSTPPWDFSLEDSLDSIEKLSNLGAETAFLAHFGEAEPGTDEIFERAADSLERWHDSYLRKREQTDSEEDLSRQFNACLEATLEPIAPSVRRDLERISPAWLNLQGLRAEQDRLGRLSDAA
jgi:glyoxylase-like metal-dependent hydrolase (beta-lactamase superfamily II)